LLEVEKFSETKQNLGLLKASDAREAYMSQNGTPIFYLDMGVGWGGVGG
jgi:hypothetical protein